MEFYGTHLRPISQEMLKMSIHKMSLKNTCKVTLTSPELIFDLQELAGRARIGKLQPHEFQGGSFT